MEFMISTQYFIIIIVIISHAVKPVLMVIQIPKVEKLSFLNFKLCQLL